MKRQIKFMVAILIASFVLLTVCNYANKSDINKQQTTMDSLNQKIEANKQLAQL